MKDFDHVQIDHLPVPVLFINTEGYIQNMNRQGLELFEYNTASLVGKPATILFHSVDETSFVYMLDQARKLGKKNSEHWFLNAREEKFWAEIVLSPLNVGNERKGFYCVITDLTERKKYETEIFYREEQYRLMVDGVKDYAIFLLDPKGYIVTWNEGARIIKGYRASEIIGKHFSTFYTAEDIKNRKPERELVIATETGKYEEEGWRVRKNGSLFWGNVVITALFDTTNKLVGFSKVTRDLTERLAADDRLRMSEERYRLLVEQVTEYGIFLMDDKGRIVSWNDGAKRNTGYEAHDIIGKYFSIFYPEEDIVQRKPARELEIARKTGRYEEEGWRIRKDGSQYWASIVITAVHDSNNTLIGFSKVTRDLTERKESEKALRDSFERYRSLTTELQAANAELSKANEELEQFTSIVSHDLQEPLRTMRSFLELVTIRIEKKEYDTVPVYVDKALKAARRMKELILNLLNYSQVNKATLVKERIDFDTLIQDAVLNLKASIDASHTQINISSDLKAVEGDKTQLTQLVQNLLSNAIKFNRASGSEIKIQGKLFNGNPLISISDNGIGIASEDLARIFEIFKRLNSEKEYPGTGIGLAICKKIVERHGGKIWAESVPGKGATFYFTIGQPALT
jgi:PAS domain S-box-containing protein